VAAERHVERPRDEGERAALALDLVVELPGRVAPSSSDSANTRCRFVAPPSGVVIAST